jgi:hypothetical protein
MLVGDAGTLYSPTDYGETYELYPKAKFKDYKPPTPTLPRSPSIHEEWLDCILRGRQPMACFDYAGRLTRTMILGNVSLRVGRRIEWDPAAMLAKNCPEAERFLRQEYRRGFELPA